MFYYHLVTAQKDMPAVETFLSPPELLRYQTEFRTQKRRDEWALGRYALKTLIKKHTEFDYLRITVPTLVSKAPAVITDGKTTNLRVSISHSNGYAAACMSTDYRVGIDIEIIEPRSTQWAQMCFTPVELAENVSDGDLTLLWTKKEAVLKALGIGLSAQFYDVEVLRDRVNLKNAALEEYQKAGGKQIVVEEINLSGTGLKAAVAYILI